MEDESLPFEGPDEMASGMEEESDDVTIQFGDDDGGGGEMFMGSEFDELEGGDGGDVGSADTWNFQAELDEVLEECAERGYEDPEIAFCMSSNCVLIRLAVSSVKSSTPSSAVRNAG